jgi:hypothetical protein
MFSVSRMVSLVLSSAVAVMARKFTLGDTRLSISPILEYAGRKPSPLNSM